MCGTAAVDAVAPDLLRDLDRDTALALVDKEMATRSGSPAAKQMRPENTPPLSLHDLECKRALSAKDYHRDTRADAVLGNQLTHRTAHVAAFMEMMMASANDPGSKPSCECPAVAAA